MPITRSSGPERTRHPLDLRRDGRNRAAVTVPVLGAPAPAANPAVTVIGAGNYARRYLLPALHAGGAQLETLASPGSTLGAWAARRVWFAP